MDLITVYTYNVTLTASMTRAYIHYQNQRAHRPTD